MDPNICIQTASFGACCALPHDQLLLVTTRQCSTNPITGIADWILYDYALTLHVEARCIWRRSFSIASLTFVAVRYSALIAQSAAMGFLIERYVGLPLIKCVLRSHFSGYFAEQVLASQLLSSGNHKRLHDNCDLRGFVRYVAFTLLSSTC